MLTPKNPFSRLRGVPIEKEPLLEVEGLSVKLSGKTLVDNLSFKLCHGEVLCVVGESGAGKSTLLKAIQGMFPQSAVPYRSFRYTPKDAAGLSKIPTTFGLPHARWVMQDPLAALNPRRSIGSAIVESLHLDPRSDDAKRDAAVAALADVEMGAEFLERRPHQVSLGQAQRACLARALVATPQLILFDEPLSALDALVQKKIAYRMDHLRKRSGLSYMVVTHDMGFARAYADHVLVLYKGEVADYQPKREFFAAPAAGYATELVAAADSLGVFNTAPDEEDEDGI